MKQMKLVLLFASALIMQQAYAGKKVDAVKKVAVGVKDGAVKVGKVGWYSVLTFYGYKAFPLTYREVRALPDTLCYGYSRVGGQHARRNTIQKWDVILASGFSFSVGIHGLYHELGISKLVSKVVHRIRQRNEKATGSAE